MDGNLMECELFRKQLKRDGLPHEGVNDNGNDSVIGG